MNYRNISLTFWTDSKVDDDFTPEDKYFYLYLLTNPHTNICGCYEISIKQMERETGYNVDTVMRLLNRMDKEHNVIRFSQETKEVLILNWAKYNWSTSEKLRQAVKSVALHVKEPDFKAYVFSKLDGDNPKKSDSDNINYRIQSTETDIDNSIQNTEIETEIDTEIDTEPETEIDTVSDTDVSIGYRYPMDRVSKRNVSDEFEKLWSMYPRKDGKKAAKAAYESAVKKGTTFSEVEKGIKDYIAYLKRENLQPKYIKKGDTYFRGEHWTDEYDFTGVNNSGRFNQYGGISGDCRTDESSYV